MQTRATVAARFAAAHRLLTSPARSRCVTHHWGQVREKRDTRLGPLGGCARRAVRRGERARDVERQASVERLGGERRARLAEQFDHPRVTVTVAVRTNVIPVDARPLERWSVYATVAVIWRLHLSDAQHDIPDSAHLEQHARDRDVRRRARRVERRARVAVDGVAARAGAQQRACDPLARRRVARLVACERAAAADDTGAAALGGRERAAALQPVRERVQRRAAVPRGVSMSSLTSRYITTSNRRARGAARGPVQVRPLRDRLACDRGGLHDGGRGVGFVVVRRRRRLECDQGLARRRRRQPGRCGRGAQQHGDTRDAVARRREVERRVIHLGRSQERRGQPRVVCQN